MDWLGQKLTVLWQHCLLTVLGTICNTFVGSCQGRQKMFYAFDWLLNLIGL